MERQLGLTQRVAALRQRLDALGGQERPPGEDAGRLQEVHRQLRQLNARGGQIDSALAEMAPAVELPAGPPPLPARLAWRTRRLLLQGRELLDGLKALANSWPATTGPDPLWPLYQQTLALAEVVLRAVQTFPDEATEQLRLCEGLEAALATVAERLAGLRGLIARRSADLDRLEALSHHLAALAQGRPVLLRPLQDLAETVMTDAREGAAIGWLVATPDRPEQWAAAHGLNTAQVLARVAEHDPDWRGRLADAVLAALVHDAGMAGVPPTVLATAGPLDDEARRQIEAHVGVGAEAVKRLAPAEGWLVDAVRAHHERLDGTGYPTGAQGRDVPRLARLLAVCDTYAALCVGRPHRPARAPRAALTETLLEAEKGRLDPTLAELLLTLGFYPAGTAVELSDGRVGVVVATTARAGDWNSPARPVVQVLLGEDGQPLPWPEHLNLAQATGRHVVRSLTPAEAEELLGRRFWYLLA
jgi:HD-GYP domain-containing protein (c-di-GMP phosphodiesterase class II)